MSLDMPLPPLGREALTLCLIWGASLVLTRLLLRWVWR